MKAFVVRRYGGPESLELVEVAVPVPGPGQVRIRVQAAAVNPVDVVTRSGALADAGLMPSMDVVGIGWDAAGVVDSVGAGADGFAPGDHVIGLRDRLDLPLGAYADYLLLDADAIAPAPNGVSPEAAATLPLGGLTADQALDLLGDLGLPQRGTVLITGAAGSVGGFAVQLAALRGLRVVALAADEDADVVRAFGADHVIPRDSPDLAAAVRAVVPGGVDAALDAALVGVRALGAVRNRGAFVAISAGAVPTPLRGIRVANVWIAADGLALERLSRLAERGALTLRVAETLPLAKAADAHHRLASGGLRGRVILVP